MAPRNKLGLTIPTDPKQKGFDFPFFLSPYQAAPSPLSPSRSTTGTSSSSSPSPQPRLPSPSFHHQHHHHRAPSPLSAPPPPPPLPSARESTSDDVQRLVHAARSKRRSTLSRQMSMCVTSRDVAWERKRRQMLGQERRRKSVDVVDVNLTDEDLRELKGSIELGFGFNEEAAGPKLCNTLPALDFYFAVNRQLSPSPVSSPRSARATSMTSSSSSSASSSSGKTGSLSRSSSMGRVNMICSPGDDPQQVKTKLRHWAQAVACSVMQST